MLGVSSSGSPNVSLQSCINNFPASPSFSYTPLLLPPSITSVSISSTLSLTIPSFSYTPLLLPPSITSVSISSTLSLTISLLQLHSSSSSSFYNQCEYLLHFKFNHPLLQLHSSSSSSFYNQCEYLLHFKFNHLPPSVTLLFFFLLL